MRIKENCHIIVDHHPYADSLKEKLRSEVELHGNHHPNNTYYTNIVGKKLDNKSIEKPKAIVIEVVKIALPTDE